MTTKSENEITVNGIVYVKKSSIPKQSAGAKLKGKMPYVLIRSYASGVHFGYLKSKKPLGDRFVVELEDSRRVHYWDGACSLSQLALEGTKAPANCRISVEVQLIEIAEVIEIIPLSKKAAENLKGVPVWKK
jgi:hypothetical protein